MPSSIIFSDATELAIAISSARLAVAVAAAVIILAAPGPTDEVQA